MPNLFKKSSSKGDASESDPPSGALPNNKEKVPQTALTDPSNATPVFSDPMKKAWEASQRKLPQDKGLLDKAGELTVAF